MSTKSKAIFLVGAVVAVFLLMIIVLIMGASNSIERQNENIRSSNCVGEFENVSCFDRRIEAFQKRKELSLYLESLKKKG